MNLIQCMCGCNQPRVLENPEDAPIDAPFQVYCIGCGMRGPWNCTKERAMNDWFRMQAALNQYVTDSRYVK